MESKEVTMSQEGLEGVECELKVVGGLETGCIRGALVK